VLGGSDAAARIGHRMYPGAARAAQAGRQGLEVIASAKDGPRHQEALLLCPFDDGNLDRPIDTDRDRRRHLFALEGGCDPFALEFEAVVIDRAGDVDCQHQSHVGSIRSGECAQRHRQGDGKSRRHPQTPHSPSRSG
jgi:hypothetical protein